MSALIQELCPEFIYKRELALDVALKATPARWWNAHKKHIDSWPECQRLLQIQFGNEEAYVKTKSNGDTDPREHVKIGTTVWHRIPQKEWVHRFIHTLDTVPRN